MIDQEDLLNRIGDLMRLDRLLPIFSKSYPVYLETLRRANLEGDLSGVIKAAHGLRGSLSMFAAHSAASAALELERTGEERIGSDCAASIEDLAQLCRQVEAELRALQPPSDNKLGIPAIENGQVSSEPTGEMWKAK